MSTTFHCHQAQSAVEKHKLDYVLTLWWKDLQSSGFQGGFVCGMIYGLSIQPLYANHRELRKELLFLFELANLIILQENFK